jgi:hypothetical protein
MTDKYILYDKTTKTLLLVPEDDVLNKLYFLEMCVPDNEQIKTFLKQNKKDNISTILKSYSDPVNNIKTLISKIETRIPLYDAYSENIYLISKFNVYVRVVHYSYRFPEKELMIELIERQSDLKALIKTTQIDDPLAIRKLRKLDLMIEFLSQLDLDVLYETYVKVFYKYSQFVGKEATLCKKSSFIPLFQHIKPYYTRNEIINMSLNLGIILPKQYLEISEVNKLCKIVKKHEMTASMLIEHQQYIISQNYVGFIQYYTLQGSFFMNQYLRQLGNTRYQNEYLEGLITPMWNLVKSAPAFDDTYTFYRFVHSDDYLSELKIGDIYKEPGFMSTTRDPFYRSDLYQFGFILLKIKIPKNVIGVALCLELVSHFPEEQEIIFPPNTCFKLIKKDEAVPYYHTDANFSSKVKIRYEFEWVSNSEPQFSEKTVYTGDTKVINFLALEKIETITLEEKINYFVSKYVNPLYQFKVMIGNNEFTTVVERYDSTGAYKNFYGLEIKNGMSFYTIYEGYILFFLELGETDVGRQMHVNYYVKYSTLDTNKILGDLNFIKFVSSVAYYFDIPNVIIYANYMACDKTIILDEEMETEMSDEHTLQVAGAKQRGFDILQIKTTPTKAQNIGNKLPSDYKFVQGLHGGSYCVDLYQYLLNGTKRYEQSEIMSIELRPVFSYYDLNILKNTDVESILLKDDRDECYQIFHKTYKLTNNKHTIASFYIWLKQYHCYLIDIFVKKISRLLANNNPFDNDMYILDPATFLYNRGLIKNYPIYTSIDLNPNRKRQDGNKNEYRLRR